MTSPAPEPAFDPWRPFLVEDALAAGITHDQLASSRWHRLFRGVYLRSTVPLTLSARARGALLLHPPSGHVSHTTAAALLGIVVPADPSVHVTVGDPRERRPRPDLRAHVREAGSDVVVSDGLRVTDPRQLFVELVGMLSLVDAVVAAESMLRRGLVSLAELHSYCAVATGRHSRTARRVLRYVREGSESPMETRLRMLLVLAGLPEPVINYVVRDENGEMVRRLDLSYPRVRLIIEFDGRHHIERVGQWEADLDRREELDESGWRTLVVTSSGIYRDPHRTVEKVRRALVARGVRVPPIKDNYRSHFPGR